MSGGSSFRHQISSALKLLHRRQCFGSVPIYFRFCFCLTSTVWRSPGALLLFTLELPKCCVFCDCPILNWMGSLVCSTDALSMENSRLREHLPLLVQDYILQMRLPRLSCFANRTLIVQIVLSRQFKCTILYTRRAFSNAFFALL